MLPPHSQAQMDAGAGGAVATESARSGRKAAGVGAWLNKVIDVEEAKGQILLALPMVLTNVAYYLIPGVSVMFAGHLGELELAGSSLANSTATVTGFSLMIGLSGALETLCGQGFGAKIYRMLGIYLQASCIINIIFSIFVSLLWWYADKFLVLLHQQHSTSKEAGLYLKYLIPGLFAYGLLQSILRFLQSQSVVLPLVVCSMVPLALHIGIAYLLVHVSDLGYKGAPLAASISLWISVFMLGLYVVKAKKLRNTWEGFTWESFSYILTTLKLALPSAAMMCLEYFAFEILILLAGLLPNSEMNTSLVGLCLVTEATSYNIAIGLSAATSTRVGNELGRGNPDQAKHAMGVTLKLTVILGALVVGALAVGHNKWAGLYSNSANIIRAYVSMTPFLVASISCDFVQAILSGVARGCGWQHLVVWINLATYYLIGVPISIVLGFKVKLHAKGLWIGVICGLASQVIGLALLCKFAKWKKIKFSRNSQHRLETV